MSPVVDRLVELRLQLDHLYELSGLSKSSGTWSLSNGLPKSSARLKPPRSPYARSTTLCRASHPRKTGLPGEKGRISPARPAFWAKTA